MDIKEFHDLFRFILNRENGGWFSPSRIDEIADRAQMTLFKEMVPIYMATQQYADALSPFLVALKSFVSDADGNVTLDGNYENLIALGVQIFKSDIGMDVTVPVDVLTPAELIDRLNSHVAKPDMITPVCSSSGLASYRIFPGMSYRVLASFLRRPVAPKFSYTIGSGREITYLPDESINLEWRDQEIINVMVRTVQMAGVNISDQMIIQYATMKEREGI